MTTFKNTTENTNKLTKQQWTTTKLIDLSSSLSSAFGFGFKRTNAGTANQLNTTDATETTDANSDTWTSEKFVEMGKSLMHIHPGL